MNGIHHDCNITACWIFHAGRDFHPAGCQSVLLVLHGSCPDRHVGEQIIQVFVVFRIKHLIRAGQTGVPDYPHMKFPCCNNAFEQIRPAPGIRLVQKTLVAVSGCTRFIGIHARDDKKVVFHFFLDAGETRQIIHHTDLIVGRTRSDDQQALLAFAGKNIPDLLIPFFFDPAHIFGQREKILDLHWNRQFPFKIHIHKKTSIK